MRSLYVQVNDDHVPMRRNLEQRHTSSDFADKYNGGVSSEYIHADEQCTCTVSFNNN